MWVSTVAAWNALRWLMHRRSDYDEHKQQQHQINDRHNDATLFKMSLGKSSSSSSISNDFFMISDCRVLWKLLKLQLLPNRLRNKQSLLFFFSIFVIRVFSFDCCCCAYAFRKLANEENKICLIIEVLVVVSCEMFIPLFDYTLVSLCVSLRIKWVIQEGAHSTLLSNFVHSNISYTRSS